MKVHLKAAFLGALALALAACADPAEYALFEADDVADLPECMAQEFPFEADFFAARHRTDNLGIFLQTTPDVRSRFDVVYFEIYDPNSIVIDEPVAVEVGGTDDQNITVRGKLSFFSSCPYIGQSFDLEGNIIFEALDYGENGLIAGRFEDGRALDARTGEVVIEELTGSWRFLVRQGPPYEDFYALPERPQPGDF